MNRTAAATAALLVSVFGLAACLGGTDRAFFDDSVDGSDASSAPDTALRSVEAGSDSEAPVAKYTVGGLVQGLLGTGLVLQNGGSNDLAVNLDGAFTFANKAKTGDLYQVSVLSQPTNPSQTCVVAGPSGSVESANVTSIIVSCSTSKFSVGGSLSGLAPSTSVVLQNNAGDNLVVSVNGSFSFATPTPSGASYAVTVLTQPAAQTCAVVKGTGKVGTGPVADVAITCTLNTYTVGGTASGVVGAGLTLLNVPNSDPLPVAANGAFTFAKQVATNAPYNVTVTGSPAGQVCTPTNGSGAMGSAKITDVAVSCVHAERFDSVVVPALPALWTSFSAVTPFEQWTTVSGGSDTAPNHAFATNPAVVSDKQLTSRPFAIQTATGQLTFRHSYDVETTYDGCVLEISIPGVVAGAFQDIVTAGGTFVSNGYNTTISSAFLNPLKGRPAWSGSSAGYVSTVVDLPAAAAGKNVTFRWRLGSDELLAYVGWSIDTITVRP